VIWPRFACGEIPRRAVRRGLRNRQNHADNRPRPTVLGAMKSTYCSRRRIADEIERRLCGLGKNGRGLARSPASGCEVRSGLSGEGKRINTSVPRKVAVGNGGLFSLPCWSLSSKSVAAPLGDRWFESTSLQRGSLGEPDFLDQGAENRQAGT
jgi:hypothetical protein